MKCLDIQIVISNPLALTSISLFVHLDKSPVYRSEEKKVSLLFGKFLELELLCLLSLFLSDEKHVGSIDDHAENPDHLLSQIDARQLNFVDLREYFQ